MVWNPLCKLQGTDWIKHCLDLKGKKTSGCSSDSWLRSKWESARQVAITTTSVFRATVFQHFCFCRSYTATSQLANLYLVKFGFSQPSGISELFFILFSSAFMLLQSAALAVSSSPSSGARGLYRLISSLGIWRKNHKFKIILSILEGKNNDAFYGLLLWFSGKDNSLGFRTGNDLLCYCLLHYLDQFTSFLHCFQLPTEIILETCFCIKSSDIYGCKLWK